MIHIKSNSGIGWVLKVGILILIVALYFLANQKIILNPSFRLTGIFKKTDGLRMGGLVKYRGVNIGVIEVIEIDSDSTVRVEMVIQEKIRKFIMEDAVATIGTDGLFGNSFVKIISENRMDRIIMEGAEINTFRPMEMEHVSETFSSTIINTERISDNLTIISQSLKRGKLFKDSLFFNNSAMALESFKGIRKEYKGNSYKIPPLRDNVIEIGRNTIEVTDNLNNISKIANSGKSGYKAILSLFADTVLPLEAPPVFTHYDRNVSGIKASRKAKYSWRNYFNTKQIKNDTLIYKN